jgi:hypothetical protein
MTGARLIQEERDRQRAVEKWTAEHDDQHSKGELAIAAAVLACKCTDAFVDCDKIGLGQFVVDPWGLSTKHRGNRKRQLVIAGALIAAEIDRLERLGSAGTEGQQT